jgi:hypothetical protein
MVEEKNITLQDMIVAVRNAVVEKLPENFRNNIFQLKFLQITL